MELKKRTFRYYETVLETGAAPEAGADMIVPDLYPDMSYIVDTSGQACIKEKSLRDDRLDVSGLIRVCILYVPEGEDGVRKLDLGIPFNHVFDGKFPPGSEALCEVRLISAESRSVNPRKVQVLCMLEIDAAVYAPAELALPDEVSEACEIRRKICSAYMPIAVKCKCFTINESMEVPATRPAVDEILRAQPLLTVTEVKTVGNKAVFKGACHLRMQYLSGGEPNTIEQEFSLSQIIEMEGLDEGSVVDIDLQMTGIEMDSGHPGEGQNGMLNIALHIEAQAVARVERRLEAVVDVYSIQSRLIPLMEPIVLYELMERGSRRQSIRELIEVGDEIESVMDSRIVLGKMQKSEDGSTACEAMVSIFYRSEEGEYQALYRRLPVVLAGDVPPDASIKAKVGNDTTATATSGGIELRFSVDFQIIATKKLHIMTVGGIQEEEWIERPKHPSVVLRRCTEGECLWDIAKAYNTTIKELCIANMLEDSESAPGGKLLLIPKKR